MFVLTLFVNMYMYILGPRSDKRGLRAEKDTTDMFSLLSKELTFIFLFTENEIPNLKRLSSQIPDL